MPTGDRSEIVVPNSFVKTLGLTDEETLGKMLDFDAAVYNWDSGEPVLVPVQITAKVVGVVDSTVKYESGGKIEEYTVDDAFFFSKPALDILRAQGKIDKSAANFTIRTKSPAEMIAIKNELNADGIVPLGRFALVEDMVRLNRQTTQQSGSAVAVIGLLSVVTVLAISMMTALSRKREYAIYMVSGYNRGHLMLMTALEFCITSLLSSVLFLCLSTFANLAATAFWGVNILSAAPLLVGVLLVLVMGASGGGKTTLLNLLVGFDTNYSGEIVVGKTDIHALDADALCRYRRDNIGFAFQNYHLLPGYTVLKNVLLACELSADTPECSLNKAKVLRAQARTGGEGKSRRRNTIRRTGSHHLY